jgi:hypothetical protein
MPIFKKPRIENRVEETPAADHPQVSILDIQKAFDTRSDRRQSEHLRVIYSMGKATGEIRAAITWEALDQIRKEMERSGKTISERGVLDFVLLPWVMDQLKQSHQSRELPPEDGYLLDFGPAPKPRQVHETLVRYGLLAA